MTRRLPPRIPRPEPVPLAESPAIDGLRRQLSTAQDTGAVVDAFWDVTASRTPLVEPTGAGPVIVTFVWRDEHADAVVLHVNRLTDKHNLDASGMRRIAGTDVWHLSYEMDPDWRASYGFIPRAPGADWPWEQGDPRSIRDALDEAAVDPRNPRVSRNRAGRRRSVVALPEAPVQAWLEFRADLPARGLVGRHVGPDERALWIYEPSPAGGGPLPVVILLDAEAWRAEPGIATTFDNLLADGLVSPAYLVMVASGDPERRWQDMDARGPASAWIVERLLPWLRDRLPIGSHPADVIVAGQSLGGFTALRAALEYPNAVGGVLSQSASLWQQDLAPLVDQVQPAGLSAWIEVGRQEWMLREPNRGLAGQLAAAGARVRLSEYNGGHDYACWRGGIAEGLQFLLGDDRSGPIPHGAQQSRRPG